MFTLNRTITLVLLSSINTVNAQEMKSDEAWKLFLNNSSVLGLVAGETSTNAVVELLGLQKGIPSKKVSGHELSSICYKSADSNIHAVFLTGYLHDTETMYGFELYKKPSLPKDKICAISEKLNIEISTPGGLGLGTTKKTFLSALGQPSQKKAKSLRWEFTFHETYKAPKITYNDAGPTNARFQQKTLMKGAYHYGTIAAQFLGGSLSKFEVFHGLESDFEIQN